MELAGGLRLEEPRVIAYWAYITPGKKTGIGTWTDRQVKMAITNGVRKTGEKMLPPMPYEYFKNIKPEDLDAIVGQIRTFQPKKEARKVRHIPPEEVKPFH